MDLKEAQSDPIEQTLRPDRILLNALSLDRELDWLERALQLRLSLAYSDSPVVNGYDSIYELPPPELADAPSIYASFCRHYDFNPVERLLLMLALAPHLRPEVLDPLFRRNESTNRNYTELGGMNGQQHGGFLPTGESAAFLLAGRDLDTRIRLLEIFGPDHPFARFDILHLDPPQDEEPRLSGALRMSSDHLELFTFGKAAKPVYSPRFPAQRIETDLEWEDLVLAPEVRSQVESIRTWVGQHEQIMETWKESKSLKPGYRALFYGPPGTGKTLTAGLIGKSAGKDVYRIDASQIVSKWVGETEKNLARIFDQAEYKDWILFFDEADALFGKRGEQNSGQERHGNQQIAYLLQRTESYPGTVILATNLKNNIDEAFMRRFQSIIYFPLPNPQERERLWRGIFSGGLPLAESVDLNLLAREFELSGGSMVNVLKYCAIRAAELEANSVAERDIREGVARELRKEGRRV